MSDKVIKALIAEAIKGTTWQKFANPSAARGKTVYPKTSGDQEKYGIRYDYDTLVNKDGTDFHTFKMQPNKGKIPSSIKLWRDKNGTDAVMATVWVKKDASAEEVEAALEAAREDFFFLSVFVSLDAVSPVLWSCCLERLFR
ncbi:hypothetical protein V8D89_015427 [Ganoderma adspersum]